MPSRAVQRDHVAAVVDFEPLEARVVFRVEGVDVSVFQGAINWEQLRANNKEFAFVRSSRTTLDLDPNFHANMAGAKAAGVITGPYHRALPLGDGDAGVFTDPVTDARRFYTAAKDYITEGHLRPVLDAEDGATLGKAALSQWWKDFIAEFQRLSGVEPIIYANTNFATNLIDASLAAEHDLWIARWNGGNSNQVDPQTDQPETPGGFPNPYGVWNQPIGGTASHNVWDFWQYTSNGDGQALGVSSARLDLDVFNGDLERMKRLFVIGHQWNYRDVPFSVGPGIVTTIEGEDYDMGGQGYAFNDTTPERNTGGAYRNGAQHGAVDVRRIANTTAALYRIDDARAGEWVEYTIDVQRDGYYKVDFRLAQADPNARVTLAVDGVRTTVVDVPDTNSFDVFTTRTRTLGLTTGKHVLRLEFTRPASNGQVAAVDWLKLSLGSETTNIPAIAGSYVRDGSFADQNFGNDPSVLAKRTNLDGFERQGYLQFDLSTFSDINGAWLRLPGRLSSAVNGRVTTNILSAADQTWDENAITWNTRPAAGSTVHGAMTVSGTSDWRYEVDLSGFLRSELAAGRKVVTLVLSNPEITTAYSIFGADDAAVMPELVVI